MGEILIGIVLIGLCLVIYLQSKNLPSLNEVHLDAGSFPQLITLLLAFLSVILILSKVKELRKQKPEDRKVYGKEYAKAFYVEYKMVLLTLLTFFVFIFLMQYIGFILTTILFIIVTGLLIGSRKKKDILLISTVAIVVTLSTYFFFENVLHVRFPTGIFF